MTIRPLPFAVVAISFVALSATVAIAQSVKETQGPISAVAATEPPARIVLDPPLAGPLSRGVVFIYYRTENLQVVPVFGAKAEEVSPRIGHLHVKLDGGPAVWAISGGPILIAGLPAGPHKVEVELATANHHPLDHGVVEFVIPQQNMSMSGN